MEDYDLAAAFSHTRMRSAAAKPHHHAWNRLQRQPHALRGSRGGKHRRSIPLSKQRFRIGALAVVALVALRLALGCHFLYEGVWKINHSDFRHDAMWKAEHNDEFKAAPFLTTAKGPVAGFFYAMVPDIDARQRLHVEVVEVKGKKMRSINSDGIADRWNQTRQAFVNFYKPADSSDAKAADAQAKLAKDAEATYNKFHKQLNEYLQANVDGIAAYFGSLDRFENDKERNQDAPFQKQRRWDRMMELRHEADKWIKDIEAQERAYAHSLYSLLDDDQQQRGLITASWNPFQWDRMKQIDFAVTFGLTAIGLCLMLGLCTPLAALGGACFMCFVVLTQPAFPTIYPPDPPMLGHALIVNKDFIEMLALLVVAATGAGRWGGLDIFVRRWIVDPFLSRKSRKTQ
jgi:uncharacterized membrane protein YphA (DoxX/SURF4 family)